MSIGLKVVFCKILSWSPIEHIDTYLQKPGDPRCCCTAPQFSDTWMNGLPSHVLRQEQASTASRRPSPPRHTTSELSKALNPILKRHFVDRSIDSEILVLAIKALIGSPLSDHCAMVTTTPPRAATYKQKRKQQQEQAKELLKIHLNASRHSNPSEMGRVPPSIAARVPPSTATRHSPVPVRSSDSRDRYSMPALYPHSRYQSPFRDEDGDEDSLDDGATALTSGPSNVLSGGRFNFKPTPTRVHALWPISHHAQHILKTIAVTIFALDLACHYCRWADTEVWRSPPHWEYLSSADQGAIVSVFHFVGSTVGLLFGLIVEQVLLLLSINPYVAAIVAGLGAIYYKFGVAA